MKFLILGANEPMLRLLKSLSSADDFRILGWYDSEPLQTQLRDIYPAGRRLATEEEFVRVAANAIVLIGSGGQHLRREDLLRDLARDAVPMTFVHPACSAIFAAELDMIQRDTGGPMIPLHADCLHPVVELLVRALRGSSQPLGTLEQIVMERQAVDRSDERVRAHLAADALLLRRLLGDFARVNALEAGERSGLSNLSVHLTSESAAITRWSIGPEMEFIGATLSLVGSAGRVKVQMVEDAPWAVETTIAAVQDEYGGSGVEFDPSDVISTQIQGTLDGHDRFPNWEDAFRALDLADAASESARRGKTLNINNARPTEEDTFKSMMAAGGCLIVLVLPLLLLLVSLVDGLQIPYHKEMQLRAEQGQRAIVSPADMNSLETIQLSENSEQLTVLTRTELYDRYGIHQTGEPKAYAVQRNEITIAPIPDRDYLLLVNYEGSFSIWKGWPILLLTPIVVFLLLQLLKLVFPKDASS